MNNIPTSTEAYLAMKKEFSKGTKNNAIFQVSAPYDNEFQGVGPRLLFVCSAGLLRSPTGAAVAVSRGINARSCGSAISYALIPISANLAAWATKIIFVNKENYDEALALFAECVDTKSDIVEKSVVLNIPDVYNYNAPDLVEIFNLFLDTSEFRPALPAVVW